MEFNLKIKLDTLVAVTSKKNIPIAQLDKQCKELKRFNITVHK